MGYHGRPIPSTYARDIGYWKEHVRKETASRAQLAKDPDSFFEDSPAPSLTGIVRCRQPAPDLRPSLRVPYKSPTTHSDYSTFPLPRLSTRGTLTHTHWHEPSLVFSKAFNEPPRMFRQYLEASTPSLQNPHVPVLAWKTVGCFER